MKNEEGRWIDPIVAEVRKVRDLLAKQFNYNLHEISQDLRQKQTQYMADGWKLAKLSTKPNIRKVDIKSGT